VHGLSATGAKFTLKSSWKQQLMGGFSVWWVFFFILIPNSFACFSSIFAFDRSFKSAYFCTNESILTHTGLCCMRNWPSSTYT